MSGLHSKAVHICDGQDHVGMCGPGELEALEFYARIDAILVPHS